MIWGQKALEDLIARIERRIDQLDERIAAQLSAVDDRGRHTEQRLTELRQRHDDQSRRTDKQLATLGTAVSAELAKLVGIAEHNFALTGRLDADVVAGFAGYDHRLENDLVALSERHHQLGERVSQMFDRIDRLEGGMTAGFAAAGDRWGTELARVAEQLGATITQLGGFVQRLDRNVGQGFIDVAKRLETDLAQVAEQSRQLGGTTTQLGEFVQRLDRDVGQGFTAVSQRLEADLAQVAEQSRQLGGTTSQLGEFVQRLDRDVGQGFIDVAKRLETDLAQVAEQSRQLGGTTTQLGEFVQRLDRDVGQGFTAVGQRLESDLVQLAEQGRQLGGAVSQLGEFLRRLDQDLGDGFAAVGSRLENDLVSLATRANQVDGSIAQLAAFVQRLDSDVGQQFASVGTRLNADLVNVAEQSRQLSATISQVGEFLQRLDRDLAQGLGAISGRLETDLVNLADRNGQLDASVFGLSQFVQRLERSVGEQFAANGTRLDTDLVIVAEQTRQLGGTVSALSEFVQRLDGNVGEQFASVGKRLDTDLIILADQSRQLGAIVSQHGEFLQRVDRDLGDGLGAIGNRLESDLVSLVERTQRLDVTVNQLTEVLQGLNGTVGEQLGAVGNRLDTDLVTLAEQNRQLGGTVSDLSGVVQKLDSNVANQFTAVGERLEQDLTIIADQSHQLGGMITELSKFLQRLDSDLAKQLASVGERLDTDLVSVSEQSRQLATTVSQLSEFMQRLDKNTAEQFSSVGQRLETDLVSLAQQSRQLGENVSQLSSFLQRLDSNVAEQSAAVGKRLEVDLSQLAENSRRLDAGLSRLAAAIPERLEAGGANALSGFVTRLSTDLDSFSSLLSRLDRDVASGFSAVGTRLETDLVTLARTTHELVESSRYASGTLSKLAADQIQLTNGNHSNGASVRPHAAPDAIAAPAPVDAPILPLAEAELPAAVRKWLARHDIAPGTPGWCLNQKLLPHTPDGLPQLTDIMAACRQRLKPGERLIWAQQVERESLLAPTEIEQVLGLLGPVQGPAEVGEKGKKWRVAIATRRVEAAGIVLRWSVPAMEALHVRLRPLADEMLGRLGLREAAHAVDLPEPDSDLANWARLLPSLVATACAHDGIPVGITLPMHFDQAPEKMDAALAHLRQALREAGRKDDIAFQWVRGAAGVAKSAIILDFAHRHGIGFDLTAVSRNALESRLAAYDDRQPYRPLPFDLRLPSFGDSNGPCIEIPRWAGRSLNVGNGSGAPNDLTMLFDTEFEQARRRLARVLDRAGQKQFELQANADATLVGYWPEYFVYNWSPPAGASLRLFEFDGNELFTAASPLSRLLRSEAIAEKPHYLNGQQLLAAAAQAVSAVADRKAIMQAQIEAHEYLRDQRPDITADTERLITWMPEALGLTLELGSGFGVMARHLVHRTTSYIGIDLTVDQAAALQQLGGHGLVADMRALPFADGTFDTILADNVIEHAANPLQGLLECERVLKPGGQAFLAVPYDYLRPEFCNRAHLWKADEASIREAVGRAGLRIVRQETVHLADLGVRGAHPSSDGQTGLWQVEKQAASVSDSQKNEPVKISFADSLKEFPKEHDAALAATNAVLKAIPGSDFSALARHSPGLENFDWANYIRLSALRMVRAGAALRKAGVRRGKILDFGSYFGNFSLFVRNLGFEVDAADQYGTYGKAFKKTLSLMQSAGIRSVDLGAGGKSDLNHFPANSYDAVLCLGVIEHIPHTPKPLLLALNRVLRPGGTLILDTPNLLYVYTREKMALGQPIAFPIHLQFDVEPPFEGHHREYASDEVVWMLQQLGHQNIDVQLFNYSIYGLSELRGKDAERFRRMEHDPQLRELIMTRSKKPMSANAETRSARPITPARSTSGDRKRS